MRRGAGFLSSCLTELRKGADIILRVSEGFDENNRLTSQDIAFADDSYQNVYTYNSNGTLNGIVLGRDTGATTGGLAEITYSYDGFLRLSGRTSGVNSQSYTYYTDDSATTSQVTQLKYASLSGTPQFDYTYDSKGNIATYTAPGKSSITYTYDANNQLISADGATDYSYTYDNAGNITRAVKNGTSYSYTYGDSTWKDLLTAYNGSTITYDTIGNPTAYYNGWNFTWEHGREMATATNGTTTLSFQYDANGLRTSKTVNGVAHNYYYYGGKLLRETYGTTVLDFYYDASGVPYMLEYNGTPYYYVTNAQGDVIRIVDSNGKSAAEYEYDPYGATVSATWDTATTNLTTINPLRYRGYVYDVESGLYYLQSRYYDPNIGRFLNVDGYTATGQGLLGNNMFSYCGNSPNNRQDPGGNAFETAFDIATIGLGIADVCADPDDPGAWIGLGLDVLDLIPCVTGLGEAYRGYRLADNIADGFSALSRVDDFGIQGYKTLRKLLKGTGLEAHHIIERRLVRHLGIDVDDMLSVALTKAEHRQFTKAWREIFKYGMDYSSLTREDIWDAAQIIYEGYPELIEAAKTILFG